MNIFAYCTARAAPAVRAATGIEPLTSPPMTAGEFDPQWLEGHDLLYFRLHGLRHGIVWYGDTTTPALTKTQITAADLGGAVAVVANCYGADSDPIVTALYQAGASVVIAGAGENVAAGKRVVGTDLLVMWIVRAMRVGMRIERALKVAKVRLGFTAWRHSDRDAMAFRMIDRGGMT